MQDSQFGLPIVIENDLASPLSRLSPSDQSYSEAYIQDIAFKHPECLPVSEIDSTFEDLIPVCIELNTAAGPLDILYVTPKGRLAIVEAKLWRNPEARRKVIGQILDYAKELANWSYEDLQREVSRATKRSGNVLYELAKERIPELDEAAFVDEVTRCLKSGRFLLMILGDGIREGAASIADFLETVGKLEFTFGLVEVALYKLPSGGTLFQPRVLAKTSIVRRIVISADQNIEESNIGVNSEAADAGERSSTDLQRFYMDFWPEWLDELKLDDPQQQLPNPTSTGNVFFPMPPSGGQSWITMWMVQSKKQAGAFLTFARGELGNRLYRSLLEDKDAIEDEFGYPLDWQSDGEKHSICVRNQYVDLRSEEERESIKAYLADSANRFVNTFRPRLQRYLDE